MKNLITILFAIVSLSTFAQIEELRTIIELNRGNEPEHLNLEAVIDSTNFYYDGNGGEYLLDLSDSSVYYSEEFSKESYQMWYDLIKDLEPLDHGYDSEFKYGYRVYLFDELTITLIDGYNDDERYLAVVVDKF